MRTLLIALAVGCGGDDGGSAKDASSIDGPPRDAAIDAPPDGPTSVQRVTCPPTVAETVTTTMTGQYAWVPASITIKVGDIVKFAPGSIHRVVPHTTKESDPGMNSGSTGEVRCLQFTVARAYNYQCAPHPAMEGLVTVTN